MCGQTRVALVPFPTFEPQQKPTNFKPSDTTAITFTFLKDKVLCVLGFFCSYPGIFLTLRIKILILTLAVIFQSVCIHPKGKALGI